MNRLTIILFLCLATCHLTFAQRATKPTIMVMPADAWCADNGYMTHYEAQGISTDVPNYKAALQNDIDLLNVITKINELMAERGFRIDDLSATIRGLEQSSAENEMLTSSTSGASIAVTPFEQLMNRAKADIIIEIVWKINETGPKRSITYTMRGLDAYTHTAIASATGTGAPSLSAELPVLLEEAVLEKMDGFTSQLMAHFEDLQTNGRDVTVEISVFDNGSGINLESEFDGEMLTDIIEEWIFNNTVEGVYNLSDATENHMLLQHVRIPFFLENGMPMNTRRFVLNLNRMLRKAPYNIESKVVQKGLGHAVLVIGEK